AEVGEAGLRVVAARRPDRCAAALLERDAVPAFPTRLVRSSDRAEPPFDLAGLLVEPDDLRTAELRGYARPRRADHDLAARDERPAVQAFAAPKVADGRVPDDLARRDVERDDMHVRGAEIEPVAVQCDAALVKRRRAALERVRVLPEQIAGARVERLHDVAVRFHEDRAVAHDRNAFRRACRQRPAPREPQVLHVARVDLLQRAEALRVVAAPPAEP